MEHLFNFRTLLGLLVVVFWLIQKLASSRSNAAAAQEGKAPVRGAHGESLAARSGSGSLPGFRADSGPKRPPETLPSVPLRALPKRFAPALAEPPRQPQAPAEYQSWQVERVAPAFAAAPAGRTNGLDVVSPAAPFNALGTTRSTSLPALVEAAPATQPGAVWLSELRQPQSARRAILLTEILGPPVGLR